MSMDGRSFRSLGALNPRAACIRPLCYLFLGMTRALYPLALDLSGKTVLVVGGGPVAARKLTELLRCGAHITLVAPSVVPAVSRLASAIKIHSREFHNG